MPIDINSNTLRLQQGITGRVSRTRDTFFEREQGGFLDSPLHRDSGIRKVKSWYFIVAEEGRVFPRGARLSGQFTAQQVRHNIGAKINESGGYSRNSPIISWLGGNIEVFTFQARLFAEHTKDNTARAKYDILRALMKRDEQLGRPPLLLFFWGNLILDGFKCMIEDLGNITYDELDDRGNIRGATLNISLKQWNQFRIEQVPVSSEERTPMYEVKDGDTYELIAQRKYGDPLLGVLLAQLNKRSPIEKNAPVGVTSLKPGEKIKIFSINELRRQRIQPQSFLLRTDNRLSLMNRRYFFDLRSKVISTIPKK